MTHVPLDPPAEISFDAGRPFFDYVSAYVAAVAGLESVTNPAKLMRFAPGDVVTLLGKVHPMLRIGQVSVHQQFVSGKISSSHLTNSLGGMLLNTAYEIVKHYNDQRPEFEFFSHARHAVSHGNRFVFNGREPIRPAAWRGNRRQTTFVLG